MSASKNRLQLVVYLPCEFLCSDKNDVTSLGKHVQYIIQ